MLRSYIFQLKLMTAKRGFQYSFTLVMLVICIAFIDGLSQILLSNIDDTLFPLEDISAYPASDNYILNEMSQFLNVLKFIFPFIAPMPFENKQVLYRADHLRASGAKIKFISAEPLLESISTIDLSGIDWLIVGGESGQKSRPLKEEWVVELRDIALEKGIAFFFKQCGGLNKKKNGYMLQGKCYREYPNAFKRKLISFESTQ